MPEGQEIAAGTSIGSAPPDTLGGLVGSGDDPTLKRLGDIKREEVSTQDKLAQDTLGTLSRDQQRLEEAYNKTAGFDPKSIKPWNEEEAAAKRRQDPLEAFGSFGSVFGILASAFTHAPMTNALNASAAAMTALKEGKEDEYQKAYKAWKDNTELALKHHQIEREAFQDAHALMQTNLAAGEVKARILASRFGDQRALTLLDAGMDKEYLQLQESKIKLAAGTEEAFLKIQEDHAKRDILINMTDPVSGEKFDTKNPDAPQNAKIREQWLHKLNEMEAEKKGLGRGSLGDQERFRTYQRAKEEAMIKKGGDLTPEEEAALQEKFKISRAAGSSRVPQTKEAQERAKAEELRKEHKDDPAWPESRILDEARKTSEHITANRVDELKGKVNRVDNMLSTIDKTVELLKKHKAITGLGGTVSRPAEAVSNVFGSDATDRRQFERYVLELQEWAPAALNDRNGRPLSAEAGKITGIIAGLRPGDTTANTARAYAELVPLLKKIKDQLQERAGSKTAEPVSATEQPTKKFRWQDAPEVGVR